MWGNLRKTTALLTALLIAGCGGGDDGFVSGTGGGGDPATGVTVSATSLTLLASSPQLGSSGNADSIISAIVKDQRNNLLADVPVTFSASSGSLEVPLGAATDGAGRVEAVLTPGGDYSNRTITVTATAGNLSDSVAIAVTGTTLSIAGETSATLRDLVTLTILLRDSDNNPIAGRTVDVTSSRGNRLTAPSLTTNTGGQVQVTVIADQAGSDTITVSAQGASASHALNVSGDEFSLLTPDTGAAIEINSCEEVTASWLQGGSPVIGEALNFSSTRGTLFSDAVCTVPANNAITDDDGEASLWISSVNAGPATLSVAAADGPSTARIVNFVATEADSINAQASPSTIGPNDGDQTVQQESTITVTVRDANNNLVSGKLVRFTIVTDNSGGTLSSATATTNLQGRASTTYISSSATTAKDGVIIRAEVDEDPSISSTVALTVARSALFVRLGTGNQIEEPDLTTYRMPYTVMVTDANGNAAAGVPLILSVNPSDPNGPNPAYAKGRYVLDNGVWVVDHDDVCQNEDLNLNGILDAGEDTNLDGKLTPGNVASVPVNVVTDANGAFQFGITYPQQYANWVHVRLTATATVDGTESLDFQDFWLPVAASDVEGADVPPPGVISPFGEGLCP